MTTPFLTLKTNEIAVLFDLDGTLINSLPDICGILNRVRGEYRLSPLPDETICRWIGRGVDHLIQGSVPEISDRQAVIDRYRESYLENPFAGGHLYPDVREVLQRLKDNGVRLGIATNKSSLVADRTLAYYLPGFEFEVVAGPERVSAQKPSPLHLLEPLKKMGIPPEQAWFIGDDRVDLESAAAAGVKFLAASYGFGGVKAPVSQQIQRFSELLEKIPLPPAAF